MPMTIIIHEDVLLGIMLAALGYLVIGPIITIILFCCLKPLNN